EDNDRNRTTEKPPTRESDPALRLRRPPCVRHTRGEGVECPRQESNLVFDLRKVACRPSHAEGAAEPDRRSRTGMSLLTRQAPHRSATSARAGAQGVEPCPRVLEARCSPRSTPLKIGLARLASSSPERDSRSGCPAGVEPVASSSTGSRAPVTPRTPSNVRPDPPARAGAEGAGVEPARL